MHFLTFDSLLTDRISFGKYQIWQFITVGLTFFCNAFQEYYQLQILEIFRIQYGFTKFQLEILASVYFLGQTLGYITLSQLGDRIGRKLIMTISTGTSFVLLFFNAFVDDLGYLIIIRFILGITFAIIEGAGKTLICEIAPLKMRGKILSWLFVCFIFGVVANGLICLALWDDVDEGEWQDGFIIFGVITFIVFLMNVFILRESPRFQLTKGQNERAFMIIDYMGKINKGILYQGLSEEDKKQLITTSNPSHNTQNPNILELFNVETRRITGILWIMLILQNLIDKGMIILIPFFTKDTKQTLESLPVYNSIELFAPFVASFMIDKPYIGRRRGLVFGYLISFTSLLIIYLVKQNSVMFCITFQRFSSRLTWNFVLVIALESYTTRLRTLGFGTVNCLGKAAGALSPFIFITLYYEEVFLPFMVLGCLTIVNIIVVFLLPYELTQKPLDNIQDEKQTEQVFESDFEDKTNKLQLQKLIQQNSTSDQTSNNIMKTQAQEKSN